MMGLFRKKYSNDDDADGRRTLSKEWRITKNCLKLILEASKSNYPNEFISFLRVDDEDKYKITEVVLIPGTISGAAHAMIRLSMLPVDYSIVGTIHSHPSDNPKPSDEDLFLFSRYGKVHIITAYPYSERDWRGYDYRGVEVDIKIV